VPASGDCGAKVVGVAAEGLAASSGQKKMNLAIPVQILFFAGLRPGDVILSIGSVSLSTLSHAGAIAGATCPVAALQTFFVGFLLPASVLFQPNLCLQQSKLEMCM
jgi:hypothetical protein